MRRGHPNQEVAGCAVQLAKAIGIIRSLPGFGPAVRAALYLFVLRVWRASTQGPRGGNDRDLSDPRARGMP